MRDPRQIILRPLLNEKGEILKERVQRGEFLLTEPVSLLPGPESGVTFKPMPLRGEPEVAGS